MSTIVGGKILEGTERPEFSGAGTPAAGTDEIQTITIGGTPETASTFKLTYEGWVTASIVWSATNNTLRDHVDAALEALPNIGTAGVTTAVGTMTSGVGTLTVTFNGDNGKKNVALMTGGSFLQSTGAASASGTVAVATTTPGVDATGRGASKGSEYTDTDAGVKYVNTSATAEAPAWVAVSVASISQEIIDLAAALPTAAVANVAGLGITIAAANGIAVAGTTPAGGTGATAGAYDTANNRDALIATVAEMKVTVNALVTEATELKLDIGTLQTTVVEIKTQLNALLAALRTAVIVTP